MMSTRRQLTYFDCGKWYKMQGWYKSIVSGDTTGGGRGGGGIGGRTPPQTVRGAGLCGHVPCG